MPPMRTRYRDARTPQRPPAVGMMAVVLLAIVATGCAGGLTGSTAQVPCPPTIKAPVLYPSDAWI